MPPLHGCRQKAQDSGSEANKPRALPSSPWQPVRCCQLTLTGETHASGTKALWPGWSVHLNFALEGSIIFILKAANKPALCSRSRHHLYLPELFTAETSLKKVVWSPNGQCACSQGIQKGESPKNIVSQSGSPLSDDSRIQAPSKPSSRSSELSLYTWGIVNEKKGSGAERIERGRPEVVRPWYPGQNSVTEPCLSTEGWEVKSSLWAEGRDKTNAFMNH